MKIFLYSLLLAAPLWGQPLQLGEVELEAEAVDSRTARLRAEWEQEGEGPFWRASLEESKASLQLGHEQDLGDYEASAEVEHEWQQELEVRKATLVVRRGQNWELGQSARWSEDQVGWSGWLATQLGEDWKARGEWQLGEDRQVTGLKVSRSGQELLLERRQESDWIGYRGRFSHQLAQGLWEVEAERRWGQSWERQWSAGVRYRLGCCWEISAHGRRRWEQLDWQDHAEAQVHWSW